MIKISGLNKSYHVANNKPILILKDINLEIKKGEIFGIIGKSGAGKSTLLKCLNLLEKPDSGNILIDNLDITKIDKDSLRKARQQIGMVFQGFNLLNSKTVFANIALPLVLQGNHTKAEIKDRVESLINLVGLSGFSDKYPINLSGGQKQRVGIARALACDPKILLSDEATSALDPQTTNSILDLLLKINQELGLTIVLITHEIDVISKICDKVAVIDHGKIVESGDTIKVLLHPTNELTRKFLIEEEVNKYLEQVKDFYKFSQTDNKILILVSFTENKVFSPLINEVIRLSGVTCNILRGEIGRMKKIPYGQMLLEIEGTKLQQAQVIELFKKLDISYEVIVSDQCV